MSKGKALTLIGGHGRTSRTASKKKKRVRSSSKIASRPKAKQEVPPAPRSLELTQHEANVSEPRESECDEESVSNATEIAVPSVHSTAPASDLQTPAPNEPDTARHATSSATQTVPLSAPTTPSAQPGEFSPPLSPVLSLAMERIRQSLRLKRQQLVVTQPLMPERRRRSSLTPPPPRVDLAQTYAAAGLTPHRGGASLVSLSSPGLSLQDL